MNRVLGVKRIYQLEYVKSVMEVIVNANSSLNHSSNPGLKALINKVAHTGFFAKITDLFFTYEWNNMYQKAYESFVTFAVNRFTPEPIIRMIFEEVKLPELFIQNTFEKPFLFESGRKMFNGSFSFVCEMSYFIQTSENVVLKRIIETNEKWKEFNILFAIPVREKFGNGIQFPKENPFEDSDKPKNIDYERSETVFELYSRCKENLSFMPKRVFANAISDCSTAANVSPLKQSLNAKEDLESHPELNLEYLDNNYWGREVSDFDFEII